LVVTTDMNELIGYDSLATRLYGPAVCLGDSGGLTSGGHQFPSIRDRPECKQGFDARDRAGSRSFVGDKRKDAQSQVLPQALVISENEAFVLAKRAAQRSAEIVSLIVRDVAVIEKVARIEGVVSREFVEGTVKFVAAGCGDDADLRSRTFAVFRAIGVLDDRKFPHCIDAQELAANASRSVVDLGSAGKLHAVQ